MELKGLWEVCSAQTFDMNEMAMVWKTKEEAAGIDDDMIKMVFSTLFDFKDDGVLGMMIKGPAADSVPKDELDAAVAAGKVVVEDGFCYICEEKGWKEEDGKVFIDSKESGEVFGEAINPWKEVIEEGNTLIVLENYQIVKVGETPTSVRKVEQKELTGEMKAAVGTYKGLYTRMICDDKKNEEEFSLELKDDGKGISKRDGLEIKVPDWCVENGEVKLTEKYLGKIDYTGKLEGKSLVLYNGDPAAPMTYEYVYEKI